MALHGRPFSEMSINFHLKTMPFLVTMHISEHLWTKQAREDGYKQGFGVRQTRSASMNAPETRGSNQKINPAPGGARTPSHL